MPKQSPKCITDHGVYLDVYNTGVLLSGDSGIGKSELALGLIDRGHSLIADDSVLFCLKDKQITGHCPEVLQDFLEVRGLGIINIRELFGNKAIRKQKVLELVINILQVSPDELYHIDRLHGMHDTYSVLGTDIPRVSIPVAPGRNLAILIEAAVKNYQLQGQGYNASHDFMDKHQAYMQRDKDDS